MPEENGIDAQKVGNDAHKVGINAEVSGNDPELSKARNAPDAEFSAP
jgi:hypothetical protein